ncbi:MAG TPA: CoA-binding protein, partial [Deltaproteobacteria bacterium]|nr:CoA-binding protein [Deltaproteobacteria bacterium]
MRGFFEAESVAVIGVSASPTNLGRAIVYNLTEFRFPGVVYPVGPKGGAFMGHKIYRSVLEIPDPVDLAVILIPAPTIPEVLKECGEKGIKRVVIESSGFSEFADDRKKLEEEILDIADEYGIRFVGPNGIGLINLENGLAVPFMPFEFEYPLGKVAVLAQSGGIGACMLNALAFENIGFSKFVSMGNKLDVNENDLLNFLMEDTSTDTIFIYLEGLTSGRKLMELASSCSKPLIIYKSNYTKASSRIAKSHSASLTSDKKAVDAAFKQAGIFQADSIRESIELIKAFELKPMRGRRLAIISRSGGHAVVAADAAASYGFDLVAFHEEIVKLVEEHSRAGVIKPQNPLDLGDLFELNLYEKILDLALAKDDIDGVCFIHNYHGLFE